MTRILAATLAAAALAGTPAAASAGALSRAQSSYAAMQKGLYLPQQRLYRGSPYSHAWPFSQALAATVALSTIPGVGGRYGRDVHDRLAGLRAYWNPDKRPPGYEGNVRPPLGRGGVIGYDDNEWIGLELVRRYQRTHERPLLRRAQQIFALVVHGWDRDDTHACPGGVVFSQDPDNVDRNTVTNAPGVELGLRLHQITGRDDYLGWATRLYDWVETCMRTESGLFQDHITFDGQIDRTIWSYNQGTMIGSNVLLWKVTRNAHYLRRARAGAAAALSYFGTRGLRAQPPFFVAIFFDNLAALDAVRPAAAYRGAMRAYAAWAWSTQRDPGTGLFNFHTDGGRVLEQAAMVRIFALLAGASPVG